MHKLLYFATIGMLACSIGGCGGGGDNPPSPSPSPGAASPSPAAQAPGTPGASPGPAAGAQTFPSPVVAAQPPGLIRSTNPDERARQAQADIQAKKRSQPIPQTVISGKANDPFSLLPPQSLRPEANGSEIPTLPVREVANLPKLPDERNPPRWTPARRGGTTSELPEPQSPTQISDLPDLPPTSTLPPWRPPRIRSGTAGGGPRDIVPTGTAGSSPGGTRGGPGAATSGGPGAPTQGRSAPRPARPPGPPAIPNIATREVPGLPQLPGLTPPPSWQDPNPPPPKPAPPPPPSTDNAKAVEVSGVVRVGNDILVIVKAPNEPTSRYIKVGQRIAGGQVLVKRVDFRSGADPIVVLEENGVEVSKAVGEKSPQVAQNPA